MQKFHLINLNTTVLGYNLANLEVAIGWFVLKRTRIRGPLWTEKRKRKRITPTASEVAVTAAMTVAVTEQEGGRGALVLIGEGGETEHHFGRRDSPTPHDEKKNDGGSSSASSSTTTPSATTTTSRRRRSDEDEDDEYRIVDVACSSHSFCKVDATGRVWTWGAGNMAPASGGSGMMTSSPTSAMSLAMRKGGGGGAESGGGEDQGGGLESLRRSLFVRSLSSHPSSSLRSGVVVLQVACGMHHVIVRDRHGA